MKRLLLVCLLLAMAFSGLVLAGTFNLQGKVLYPNGDGLNGITVRLYDKDLTLIQTTTTNPSGVFTFKGVLPDYTYTIVPEVPTEYCSGFSPEKIMDVFTNESRINFTGACRPAAVNLISPINGAIDVPFDTNPTLVWSAPGATDYRVYFGIAATPPFWTAATATSIPTVALAGGTTYYWRVTASNDNVNWVSSATWSFTTAAAAVPPGYRFVPITPCRVADTRASENLQSYFRGPSVNADQTRTFTITGPQCGVPPTAEAVVLNATAVPLGDPATRRINRVVVWGTNGGATAPATLNLSSDDGRIVADAVITGVGNDGAVNVYASDATDVILDVNGYFDRQSGSSGNWFYPLSPCRLADTREAEPQAIGGKFVGAAVSDPGRPVTVAGAGCKLTQTGSDITVPQAAAYSLNFTVVPDGFLDYLTAYPTGVAKPYVSTLNSYTGIVVANAAIVPAGTAANAGKITVYTTDPTQVIIDANGFFGPQTMTIGDQLQSGLSFFPITPCRAVDTQLTDGTYGGPILSGGDTRTYNIASDGLCGVPATAKALVATVTVKPVNTWLNGQAFLDFLTAYPTGIARPWVSTLNSYHGGQVSNTAIVPVGTSGGIQVYITQDTHVAVDVAGYFK